MLSMKIFLLITINIIVTTTIKIMLICVRWISKYKLWVIHVVMSTLLKTMTRIAERWTLPVLLRMLKVVKMQYSIQQVTSRLCKLTHLFYVDLFTTRQNEVTRSSSLSERTRTVILRWLMLLVSWMNVLRRYKRCCKKTILLLFATSAVLVMRWSWPIGFKCCVRTV